jgi:hypothetical protein
MTDLPFLHGANTPAADHDDAPDHEDELEPGAELNALEAAADPATDQDDQDDEPPAAPSAEDEPTPTAEAAKDATADPADPAPAAAEEGPKEPFWYRKTIKGKDQRIRELERELEQRRADPPPAAAPPEEGEEDYVDPVIARRIEAIETTTRLNISERFARKEYGSDKVDELLDWATELPDLARWAMQQPDPYDALMQSYRKEAIAAEIGDDPNAWREREREKLRQEILAETRTTNRLEPAPQATPPNPASPARIPAPAATERSAAPAGPAATTWSGPTPLTEATKNRF